MLLIVPIILLILFIFIINKFFIQYVARLEESNKKTEAELLESKQQIAELLESKQRLETAFLESKKRLDCNKNYIQFLIFTLMPFLLFPVFYECKAKDFDA